MNARAQFSLDPATIGDIFTHAKPLGHHEDPSSLNLGFGFLYYGLVRSLRPRHIVVVGSGFGFSVVCLALAMRDNGAGAVSFIDPSDDSARVKEHFQRFRVEDKVTHFRMTSAEFFDRYDERKLPPIDLAFIDGNHAFADVRHDFISAMRWTHRNSYLLLHDTNLYIREMIRHAGVKRWLAVVRRDRDSFEVVDFPFSSGVALVRVLRDGPWHPGV